MKQSDLICNGERLEERAEKIVVWVFEALNEWIEEASEDERDRKRLYNLVWKKLKH